MEKILLDTDPGSDIDDSYCIAYLLKHPECELMGITTVTGEPMERCKIADAICQAAGRQVEIYCGSGLPMTENTLQTTAKQKTQLKNWPHRESFPYGAAEFMNRVIRENPGEVTLLAIGPLTNVATLFTQYPETPMLLKRLVLINGAFFDAAQQLRPVGEWNSRCDARASQIVYNTPVPEFITVGLDVTCQVLMRQEEVQKHFTSPILKMVEDFSKVWFNERDVSAFHDPLAAMMIFDPEVCELKRGHARIEPLSNCETRAVFEECPCGRHQVAVEVNAELFFEKFFAITNR